MPRVLFSTALTVLLAAAVAAAGTQAREPGTRPAATTGKPARAQWLGTLRIPMEVRIPNLRLEAGS